MARRWTIFGLVALALSTLSGLMPRGNAHAQQGSSSGFEERERVAADEARTGRCRPERQARMEHAIQVVTNLFETMGSGSSSEHFIIEFNQVVVARPDRLNPVVYTSSHADELHIFGLSFEPFVFGVGNRERTVTMHSQYEQPVAQLGGSVDSRTFHSNAGERIGIGLRGSGCAAIVVVRRY